jgi:hypothetical protein
LILDIVYYSRNLCQLKTPCHRCEPFRACDAHLMGIKCTCEGGIHRFTMYLKRNCKRFDVRVKALTMLDAHSIRIMKRTSECRINERVWKASGSVSPVTNCGSLDVILPTTEFCLKLNLYYLILAPLLEFMEIFYCINHNVR